MYRWAALPVCLFWEQPGNSPEPGYPPPPLPAPAPSVTVDTPMWWRAKYQGCCHFRRWRSCCWHQPALSKAACVKECVYCWDTFIITFSFSLPHTGGFSLMCPEGFHMRLWIQMWTNTGPAAQIYTHVHPALPPPPQKLIENHILTSIDPSIQQFLEIIGISESLEITLELSGSYSVIKPKMRSMKSPTEINN